MHEVVQKTLCLFKCRRRYEERDERRFRRGGPGGGEMRSQGRESKHMLHVHLVLLCVTMMSQKVFFVKKTKKKLIFDICVIFASSHQYYCEKKCHELLQWVANNFNRINMQLIRRVESPSCRTLK